MIQNPFIFGFISVHVLSVNYFLYIKKVLNNTQTQNSITALCLPLYRSFSDIWRCVIAPGQCLKSMPCYHGGNPK